MLEDYLGTLYQRIRSRYVQWVESNPLAEGWVALGLCLFCICISFPSYEVFIEPNDIVLKNWAALQTQVAHPLTPAYHPAEDHAGQIAYRILLPTLAHVLHFPILFFFVLQHIAGWYFFRLLLKLGKLAGLAPWPSLLLALGMAATYVGKAFFVDVIGYFDGFCFLGLCMALLYRQYWVAFGLYIACFFIDERAFLAVPLVCVARFFLHRDTNKWQRGLPEVGLAIAAIVTGLLVRFWLHTAYGLENGATSENLGLATARDNFQISGFGLLTGLDFWTFAGMFPAFLAWQKGWRWLASGYLIYYICCFLAMLLVLDLTRCTAYLFPAALAGVIAIARQERPVFAERFVLFFTLTALLFPPVFVVGDYILWMGPIFPKLVRVVAQLGFGVHI